MHIAIAEAQAHRLAENSSGQALLAAAHRAVRQGRWPWLSALGQPYRDHWTAGALLYLSILNDLLQTGLVALTRVDLGQTAAADRHRELNAGALEQAPAPFRVTLHREQNNSPAGDGHAAWDEPIRADVAHGKAVHIEPRAVPLEVGSTHPFTTYAHVVRTGGVFRWPYNQTSAYVLTEVERGSLAERVRIDL